MDPQSWFEWLNETAIAVEVRESLYLFPALDSLHIAGLCVLVGSVVMLDLRLLGLAFRQQTVSSVARTVLPPVWLGFAITLVSGVLLLASQATRAYGNPAFWVKMGLLVAVGINPLVFHLTVYRRVAEWDHLEVIPWNARLAGALSLGLWTAILIAGRAMAYFS